MESLSASYRDYVETLKLQTGIRMNPDVAPTINRLMHANNFVSKYAPVAFLSDYTQGKYIYVDELCFTVLGFTAKYFIESGVDSYLSKMHPADFEIFNHKIFPYNIDFLKIIPPEKYQDIVFSHNYRILNAEGTYLTMLQRFSFIAGNISGMPLGILGIIVDITHFKTDDTVIHTIEEVSMQDNLTNNTTLFKKSYFPNQKLLSLSKRELEILKLMSQGYSSKQIGYELGISIHTINNHRKNMLHKTNSANASELLNSALKHGLI